MQDCEGNLAAEQVAERADISRPTLVSIEKGNPNVTIGAYVKVLSVLGLENDIMEVAKDDKLGRRLQDAKLIVRERAPKILKNDTLQSNPQVSKIAIKGKPKSENIKENRWKQEVIIKIFMSMLIGPE